MSCEDAFEQGSRAVTLWRKHPDSVPLDPQVWWWRDMSKMIAMIPNTTKPIVETAVLRLASQYWQRGSLPSDIAVCAKMIGYRRRTLEKHWHDVVELLETYFVDMVDARREVVKQRVAKQIYGRRGGLAATAPLKRGEGAAKAPTVYAGNGHFLEAEIE
jgi:hypothetical protein